MNDTEFEEEWLSAYLDDELTEEQRQVVEQLLASDPATQATLDDLRRVRGLVAKLPTWSGRDVKFDIPKMLRGRSIDENEFDDFEEVPRSLVEVDEPPVKFVAHANLQRPAWSSRRSLLTWSATAASALLMLGIGYGVWSFNAQRTRQFSLRSLEKSAPTATGQTDVGDSGKDSSALVDAVNLSEQAAETLAGGVTGAVDTAKKEVQPDAAALALRTGEQPLAPHPAQAFSLNSPIAAELPPPSPVDGFKRDEAPAFDQPANVMAKERAGQQPTLPGLNKRSMPAVRFARSSGWMESETQLSLAMAANLQGRKQINPNPDQPQVGVRQLKSEEEAAQLPATETVLMAAVKADATVAAELFSSILVTNSLIEVDPDFSANAVDLGQQVVTQAARRTNESAALYSNDARNQSASSAIPQGNSLVLFVTREEASHILSELQQRGQVSSQVWRITRLVTPPTAKLEISNSSRDAMKIEPIPAEPAPVEPLASNPALAAASSQSMLERTTGIGAPIADPDRRENVILLLNGPPQ